MAQQAAIAALLALAVWWSSTGAILLAVRRADRAGGVAHGMTAACAVPLLVLGAALVAGSAGGSGLGHVYAGFLGAVAVWGWIELAFLLGVVTGPESRPATPGLAGWARFARAWGTVAHHELALLAGLLGVALLAAQAPTPVAVGTYGILFAARILAKLNLFLGVPRINTAFLPQRLLHLQGYFRRGPATPLYAVTVAALGVLAAWLATGIAAAPTLPEAVAAALLAALAGLALAEHALMVLPLPDDRLWRWMLPEAAPAPAASAPPARALPSSPATAAPPPRAFPSQGRPDGL